MVIGVVAIQGTSLLARVVGLPGGWFAAVGIALMFLGFFFRYVAWTSGLGAAVLAFSARGWRRKRAAAAAEPPAPAPQLPGASAAGPAPEAPESPSPAPPSEGAAS